MDIFKGKNKRYCKRLTKFGRNIVLRIKPRAAMFVVRFANFSLARSLTNPRVIAWLPALKGPLEPRLITVLSLLKPQWKVLTTACRSPNMWTFCMQLNCTCFPSKGSHVNNSYSTDLHVTCTCTYPLGLASSSFNTVRSQYSNTMWILCFLLNTSNRLTRLLCLRVYRHRNRKLLDHTFSSYMYMYACSNKAAGI